MQFKNIYTSTRDVETYKEAGKLSADILKQLKEKTKEGATPFEINELAEGLCKKNEVVPAFKGVRGPTSDFPGAVCISVNDETLHTIPFSKRKFKSGDIIKIDFGIIYKNFATDHCITIGIGKLTDEEKRLINTAKNCVETAIKKALSGNTVGDISFALQTITELEGFEYVRDYAGHGIGKLEHGGLHIVPSIPSFGMPGTGRELVEGQTICIENQVSLGAADLILDDDDWTLKTVDGSKTAMFEHTVMVGKKKPLILTKLG